MEPWLHISIVALVSLFFIISFIKQRKLYQIVFTVWVLSTLLKYVSTEEPFLTILGVVQIIFFFICIFLLFRNKKTATKNSYSEMLKNLDAAADNYTASGASSGVNEIEDNDDNTQVIGQNNKTEDKDN